MGKLFIYYLILKITNFPKANSVSNFSNCRLNIQPSHQNNPCLGINYKGIPAFEKIIENNGMTLDDTKNYIPGETQLLWCCPLGN